ncbi:MAG: polysaccharide deacetylase [bacterium]|nr:polysaccharide deacetylase [bacterium]
MALKDFLRSQAYDSPLARFLTARASRFGAPVFMLHHTLPAGSECYDEGMDTEAQLFERFVVWLDEQFRIVPLTALAEMHAAGESLDGVCAITIDDGWRDTYEQTFPILRSHGVAATVFLPLDYIGTDRQFWTDALWDVHRQLAEKSAWRELNRAAEAQYPGWPRVARQQTLAGILERVAHRPMAEAHELIRWASTRFGLSSRLRSPAFMTWEQVREMRDCGFTFGSHTNSHVLLTRVSSDEARQEITSSKQRLEELLDTTVSTFCYPSGDHDANVAEIVRQAGYRVAVTVEPRLVTRRDSLWTLPRVGISSLSLRSRDAFNPNAIRFQLARAGVRARLRGPARFRTGSR